MANIVTCAQPNGDGIQTLDLDDKAAVAAYNAQKDKHIASGTHALIAPPSPPLRLDLGCGKNKLPGYTGVDSMPFEGVDVVADLRRRWPWADESVDEIRTSHFVEHLTMAERTHFANEAFRVLKKGGQCQIIVPHWSSSRAYGDPTHQMPPVCEFWLLYLNRAWRDVNAPHCVDFTCDFDANPTYGYAPTAAMVGRSQEYVAFALNHYREAAADMIATLTKPK